MTLRRAPTVLRLIFGGQAIALALALAVWALPNIVTVLAWRGCDHLAQVFEAETLGASVTVEALHALPGGGGMVDLRAIVWAERSGQCPTRRQVQATWVGH